MYFYVCMYSILYTCIGAWCSVVYCIYLQYIRIYIYIVCNLDVVFFAALKGFAMEAAHEQQP